MRLKLRGGRGKDAWNFAARGTITSRGLVGLLLLVFSTACFTQRIIPVARTDSLALAPACYELVPGPWQTDSLLRSIFNPQGAPRRFKLDTTRLVGWEPLQERASFVMYNVHAYPDSGQNASLFTYWARPGGQSSSLVVSYPLPLAGVRLVMQTVGSGLTGQIHSFTDALQPGKPSSASAPITARRITCPPES